MSTNVKFTEFGKSVKIALIEKGKTQKWLIDQLKERTGKYYDSSNLHKIFTGKGENMETILSIIAIIISVVSGGFALYTFLWTVKRDRKQATLEAYNRLQNEVFDKLNLYTPSEIADICEDTKSDAYKEISGLVARIEHFCVGINTKIYDEKVFYSLAHGYFDGHQLRKRIKPLIDKKNESSNRPDEVFYNDTIAVLEWMDKKAAKK